jgi:phage/plasmid-associated DNA primase
MGLGKSLGIDDFCKDPTHMIKELIKKVFVKKLRNAIIVLSSCIMSTSSDIELYIRITIPRFRIRNRLYNKFITYLKRLWPKDGSLWKPINDTLPTVSFDIDSCYRSYIYHRSNLSDDKEPYRYYGIYRLYKEDQNLDRLEELEDVDSEIIDNVKEDYGDAAVIIGDATAWICMHKCDTHKDLRMPMLEDNSSLHGKDIDIDFDDTILTIMMKMIQLLTMERIAKEIYMKEIASAINNMVNRHNMLMTKKVEKARTLYEKVIRRVKNVYDEKCIERIWAYALKCKRCTILTILEYAREDNPVKFDELFTKYYMMPLSEIDNFSDTVSLAKFIYRLLCLNVIMVCGTKNIMYENENGHLLRLNDPNERVRSYIVDGAVKQIMQEYVAKLDQLKTGHKQMFAKTISGVSAMLEKLKRSTYVSQVVKAVLEEFASNGVNAKYLDSCPHFTSISNGMIEVYDNRPCYREAKIEDLLSKTSLLTYDPNLNDNHSKVLQFKAILVQYYGDEISEFMSRIFASRLVDGNINKKILYLIGPPDSGKSTLTGAFMRALGDYGTAIANNLLETNAGKNSTADSATPAMTQAASARLGVGQEVSGRTDSLKLKHITGGDSVSLRHLYEEMKSVQIKAFFIMGSNDYPTFTSLDTATRGRLIILPMTARFSDEAPATEAEQKKQRHFPKVEGFTERLIENYNDCMLWLMMKYYNDYAEHGLDNVPKISEQLINQHILGADVNVKYVQENLTEADERSYVLKSEVYEHYKSRINSHITYNGFLKIMGESYLLGRGTSIRKGGNIIDIWRGRKFRNIGLEDSDTEQTSHSSSVKRARK